MRAWWESRAPRERLILIIALLALGAMLYFLIIWEPIIKAGQAQALYKQDQQELNQWLRQISPQIQQLRRLNGKQPASRGSVLSVADSTAKADGLAAAIKRMQPDGDQTVRVWLENAPFNTLVAWLQKLEKDQGIHISDLNINQDDSPGHVKARLTLKR